ncbi:MAG: hypothetical protein LBG95_05130 [Treponema sp.]|nr:hypothetical protein [Treponema sp.]
MKRTNLWFIVAIITAFALVFAGCASSGGGGGSSGTSRVAKFASLRTGDKSVVEGFDVTLLKQQESGNDGSHTEVWFDELVNAKPGSEVYFFFIKEASNIDGYGDCGVIGPDWSEAPNPGNIAVVVPMGTGKNKSFRMGPYNPNDVVSWEAGWADGRVVLGSWANGVTCLDRVELWEPASDGVEE